MGRAWVNGRGCGVGGWAAAARCLANLPLRQRRLFISTHVVGQDESYGASAVAIAVAAAAAAAVAIAVAAATVNKTRTAE